MRDSALWQREHENTDEVMTSARSTILHCRNCDELKLVRADTCSDCGKPFLRTEKSIHHTCPNCMKEHGSKASSLRKPAGRG